MFKKTLSILMATMLIVLLASTASFAAGSGGGAGGVAAAPAETPVSLNLGPVTANPGNSVNLSGAANANTWVSVKVLDSAGQIVFFDAVKSKADGQYEFSFKVPSVEPGVLTVVAGYGSNVASANLTVTRATSSGGGPGSGAVEPPAAKPAESTTGAADVKPDAGGKISLGDKAKIDIPAGALKGTEQVKIEIKEVAGPPPVAENTRIISTVYEFTIGEETSYSFSKPVTLTFAFDPEILTPGEIPSVHYYEENTGVWVELGGTVSGDIISVAVEHFTKFVVLAVEKKADSGPVLKDIAMHWARDNIKELIAKGAIAGYEDQTFRPDKDITRAEFATVLVKALQLEAKKAKTFVDTASHWAREDITTANAHGIVAGYSDEKFGPDDKITREQMAVMIVKSTNLSTDGQAPSADFSDSAKISAWAGEAVAAAARAGIIKGYSDGSFRPQGQATRAEAATVIVNIFK